MTTCADGTEIHPIVVTASDLGKYVVCPACSGVFKVVADGRGGQVAIPAETFYLRFQTTPVIRIVDVGGSLYPISFN